MEITVNALLQRFVECTDGVEHIVLGNSFGTTVASFSTSRATTSMGPLGTLFAATFGVSAETFDKLAWLGKTRSSIAYFEDFTLVQFSAFPLVLAIAVSPSTDVDPIMQAVPELLATLEPLRAAAENM